MQWLMAALRPLIYGFLFRCRGGFMGLNHTTLARLVYWAFPVGFWGASIDLLPGAVCGAMAFLGLLIPHALFQAGASLKNAVGMAGVGLARMGLILAPLAYFHPLVLWALPAGALAGFAYTVGWLFLDGKPIGISFPGLKLFGVQLINPSTTLATGGSEWGELLTGIGFGVGFSVASILV